MRDKFHQAVRATLREFVFGMEDGLVSNLGLVLGVYFSGSGIDVVVVAGLASMFAGAFSMSAGSYLSAKSQREVYEHEIYSTKENLKNNPKKYLKEMKHSLKSEGFDPDEVEALLHHFEHHNHSTFVTNYIQKRVGLSEHRLEHPLRNALTMFFSFLIGSLFPVLPFVMLSTSPEIISVILTIGVLFAVGVYKTVFTKRDWFKSGLEVVLVGLGAGLIGYIIGLLIG